VKSSKTLQRRRVQGADRQRQVIHRQRHCEKGRMQREDLRGGHIIVKFRRKSSNARIGLDSAEARPKCSLGRALNGFTAFDIFRMHLTMNAVPLTHLRVALTPVGLHSTIFAVALTLVRLHLALVRVSLTKNAVALTNLAVALGSNAFWDRFFRVATGFLAPEATRGEAMLGLKQLQQCLAGKRADPPQILHHGIQCVESSKRFLPRLIEGQRGRDARILIRDLIRS